MNTQLKNSNGFTLVETLVAIGVLLLAIIGPMTVAQKGIQNAQGTVLEQDERSLLDNIFSPDNMALDPALYY